jgi:hypothetical protein
VEGLGVQINNDLFEVFLVIKSGFIIFISHRHEARLIHGGMRTGKSSMLLFVTHQAFLCGYRHFEKSGMHILKGMLDDRSIDEIIKGIPSGRVKKNADKIKESIENNLEPNQIFLIDTSLDLINKVQDKIDRIDMELKREMRTSVVSNV